MQRRTPEHDSHRVRATDQGALRSLHGMLQCLVHIFGLSVFLYFSPC